MRRLFVLVPAILCLSCATAPNKFVRPPEVLSDIQKPQRIIFARRTARDIAEGECRYVKVHAETRMRTVDARGFEVECGTDRTILWVGVAHLQRAKFLKLVLGSSVKFRYDEKGFGPPTESSFAGEENPAYYLEPLP